MWMISGLVVQKKTALLLPIASFSYVSYCSHCLERQEEKAYLFGFEHSERCDAQHGFELFPFLRSLHLDEIHVIATHGLFGERATQ